MENKTNNNVLKIVLIIGAIFGGLIILAVSLILFTSMSSKKLVCTSNVGDITLMYNDKVINGYTASGISYDLDGQKIIAKEIGIDEYLNQFTYWFRTNTNGTCIRK